jgi:hypothetical protein
MKLLPVTESLKKLLATENTEVTEEYNKINDKTLLTRLLTFRFSAIDHFSGFSVISVAKKSLNKPSQWNTQIVSMSS